ncbi:MAG: glycoside hydrolase family 127 protein [Saprospiraceae bacterium]
MRLLAFFALASIIFSCKSIQEENKSNQTSVFQVYPFSLSQVTLLEGPFKEATKLNAKVLLAYQPDRFLAKFRAAAGLEPRAAHYEGWEAETIAGHSLGHYLSGCALMYQTTGDTAFLHRVNYIVEELALCQKADGDGFIGAFPNGKKVLTEEVAKGDIRSQGFDLNGIWVPYYNLHKTMAGLRDAYRLCDNKKALEVEKHLADWLAGIVEGLNQEQVQNMLHCEHGGINETLVDLYADTGAEKYLHLANIFYHEAVLTPLAQQTDVLPGLHGNTQIPKLIGLARRYELTQNASDQTAASFFWDRVVNHHSYVTGGHGNHEYFGQPDQLRNRLSDETTETCNVYNMLKLSEHLFEWEASAAVADFYERALFNHILSAQNPADGRVIYNLSLEMGGKKDYQDPEGFTCCVGTGMETHSKYGANIFYHNEEDLYLFQFIAAELNWPEKGLRLRQTTAFPEEQATTLRFSCAQPLTLALQIRYPHWLENGKLELSINGEAQEITGTPGSFIRLHREWKDGDEIKLEMPFDLRLEPMPDDADRVAICYGPLVLAADLGPANDPLAHSENYVPVIMTEDRQPANWLKQVEGEVNTFITTGVGDPRDVTLHPLYKTNERRYSVYLDLFTAAKWEAQKKAYAAEVAAKKALEARTYDFFELGEMQPERNHHLQGDKIRVEHFKDKKFRVAERGGWFSFNMKVLPDAPLALVFEYWGGFTGSKTFDILVDDEKIATENISQKADGQFIDITYPIPANLTKGKQQVTIRIQPHVGHRGGPLFSARVVKE